MPPLRRQSLVEQTTAHLREGLFLGRWSGYLPGVGPLAADLAVSKDTVRAALRILEKEGAVKVRGAGKRRQIATPHRTRAASHRILRFAILLNEPLESDNSHSQHLFLTLKHSIEVAGHVCFFADETLAELRHKPARVARLVKATEADAWVIYAGTRDVLEWFAQAGLPTLAVGGRAADLPIAGTRADLVMGTETAIDALTARGHRRIVMICPYYWRHPTPNPTVVAFFTRLKHHRISPGDYNLPEWEETAEGLQTLFDSLFFATPPTALLLAEPTYTVAALTFLGQSRLRVPQDVSLISLLSDPVLALCRPTIAHFRWPAAEHIRRAMRWVKAVALGTRDHNAIEWPVQFEPGGTIGPAKK